MTVARRTTRLFTSFLILGAVLVPWAQQSTTATIRREKGNVYDPVRIVGVYVDRKFHNLMALEPPVPFAASENWIDSAQILVKNVSDKTLVAGRLQINCPGIGQGGAQTADLLDFLVKGQVPRRYLGPSNSGSSAESEAAHQLVSIPPDGNVVFVVATDSTGVRSRLHRDDHPVACEFGLRDFHFSDGSMWRPHQFFNPDPDSQYGYVKVSPQQFGTKVQFQ